MKNTEFNRGVVDNYIIFDHFGFVVKVVHSLSEVQKYYEKYNSLEDFNNL